MGLTLRRGLAADAGAIEELHWAGLDAAYRDVVPGWSGAPPDRAGRLERWEAWLADPGIDVMLGCEGPAIIGFCTLRA